MATECIEWKLKYVMELHLRSEEINDGTRLEVRLTAGAS